MRGGKAHACGVSSCPRARRHSAAHALRTGCLGRDNHGGGQRDGDEQRTGQGLVRTPGLVGKDACRGADRGLGRPSLSAHRTDSLLGGTVTAVVSRLCVDRLLRCRAGPTPPMRPVGDPSACLSRQAITPAPVRTVAADCRAEAPKRLATTVLAISIVHVRVRVAAIVACGTYVLHADDRVAGQRSPDMVPGAGLEPAWPKPRDFKSLVSTDFTTRADSDQGGRGCGPTGRAGGWRQPVGRKWPIGRKSWAGASGKAPRSRKQLEAEVGIEPASTALQAAA